ncbi:major facilitator superfamily domain-containing protein [Aspergillus caelatus]|uniref:Major facilitator superfamily domain-containing protein n=1 Tax=Aspergillus caelatus TaxID=61420 RepID=A0A5N6ZZL6_9EURO|nr:major facilitator superfamily domain-containing protein [Aspergillus caelatus]KAE8361730.1 major facilitator superfamily domain-containing protein [Aspergillus caelatus]
MTKSPEHTIDPQRNEVDQEKSLVISHKYEEAPDGGARAWLVAAGGASLFFCCLGFANSFGTFEEYYLSHQLRGQSPDNIAWIGSLAAFLQFATGAIAGPLFDRYGAWIIRPAAVAYVFAMMVLSLCKTYWQTMLVQGVLMGVVTGFLQFPAFPAVSQWFDKKRAAALGIAAAGSSVGGIVIPIALSKMLNGSFLGFGWSVRVIGFLIMPIMAFACLTIKRRLPPSTSPFWIPSALREAKFALLIVSLFFMFIGMFFPLFYIPTYAVSRGMSATLSGYLLAILNAASTFGRIIPGILADKFGRLNAFTVGGITTGIVIFCFNLATTNAGLIVYSVVIGFTSGTIISGASAAFTLCPKDPRDMGTYMGMGMALSSLATLIGPPVNGALVKHYGGYSEASIFSGVMCLAGGFFALATKAMTPQGILGRT